MRVGASMLGVGPVASSRSAHRRSCSRPARSTPQSALNTQTIRSRQPREGSYMSRRRVDDTAEVRLGDACRHSYSSDSRIDDTAEGSPDNMCRRSTRRVERAHLVPNNVMERVVEQRRDHAVEERRGVAERRARVLAVVEATKRQAARRQRVRRRPLSTANGRTSESC